MVVARWKLKRKRSSSSSNRFYHGTFFAAVDAFCSLAVPGVLLLPLRLSTFSAPARPTPPRQSMISREKVDKKEKFCVKSTASFIFCCSSAVCGWNYSGISGISAVVESLRKILKCGVVFRGRRRAAAHLCGASGDM